MQVTNFFELSRFWQLMKMELFRSRKGVGMTLVIIFGLLFFVDFLLGNYLEPNRRIFSHGASYGFTLITGGFILSSLAFRDLGNALKKIHFVMLPVSALERFLCMWFLTSLGWMVTYTMLYFLYTVFVNAIGPVLFQHISFIPFRPFSALPTSVLKYYFVLQGIFLVGVVHFKGFVLPKTLFVLILIAIVGASIAYVFLSDVMDAETEHYISKTDVLETMPTGTFWNLLVGMFWWVLAPLSWVITYMGIKEQEV